MEGSESEARISELERDEIDAILARNHVGRIGYTRGRRIDIQPVHYVFSDGWIYGRTSFGAKYEALGQTAYHWWPVVFEVDEVDDLFHWRSVLVHGGFYALSRDGTDEERETWIRALELLRTLVPETLRTNDPAPHRSVLFRIAAQEASGRMSVP